jgi:hypothetical protein
MTWSCYHQGLTCQIVVVVGEGGFISSLDFLHFVRIWEKESLWKRGQSFVVWDWVIMISGYLKMFWFCGILKPLKGYDMFTRENSKRFDPSYVP